MTGFVFYDAAGDRHPFDTREEAEAFALACGYVFVASRRIMEGEEARISYFLAASDIPPGVSDPDALFAILLARYPEWREPRIMPVVGAE